MVPLIIQIDTWKFDIEDNFFNIAQRKKSVPVIVMGLDLI